MEMETLRVALIGKTGAGKSALGNTLLGETKFKSSAGAEGLTCEIATGMLPSGRQIKVVDTPGIMDIRGTDVSGEVAKALAALSPGPHAFIIVLQPETDTAEEKEVIKKLTRMFGDEGFLAHTMIVMTRWADITNVHGPSTISHSLIQKLASPYILQLDQLCGGRIVAVENTNSSSSGKGKYAMEVMNAILKIGGYYSHPYFDMLANSELQAKNTAMIKSELVIIIGGGNTIKCTIL